MPKLGKLRSLIRRRALFVAAAAGALALSFSAAGPASAYGNNENAFSNDNTGRCMDFTVSGGLRGWSCNGTAAQGFMTIDQAHSGAQWFSFKSSFAVGCLDDSQQYGLRVWTCNNQSYQNWRLIFHGATGYDVTLINENTGRCIDDSSAYGLRSFPCNGMNYQNFTMRF
ncbi:actinohivin [Streptomyces sp. NPDC059819]|uniref:RICIN domain-containing protein n=1 Tax=Streptomyces sp. NPDC059819 TaxID=3346963 RepID=UPI003647FD2E